MGVAGCAARHGGPVIDGGETPPERSGTISGTVRAAGSNAPLSARRVIATDLTTGATFEASTAVSGGYTMKVPMGRYRLQVDLADGEVVTESPGEIEINRSDLDAGLDFLITVKASGA